MVEGPALSLNGISINTATITEALMLFTLLSMIACAPAVLEDDTADTASFMNESTEIDCLVGANMDSGTAFGSYETMTGPGENNQCVPTEVYFTTWVKYLGFDEPVQEGVYAVCTMEDDGEWGFTKIRTVDALAVLGPNALSCRMYVWEL